MNDMVPLPLLKGISVWAKGSTPSHPICNSNSRQSLKISLGLCCVPFIVDMLCELPTPAPVPFLAVGLIISSDIKISIPRNADPRPKPRASFIATSALSHLEVLKMVKSLVSRDVPPASSDGQSREIEHDASRLHKVK